MKKINFYAALCLLAAFGGLLLGSCQKSLVKPQKATGGPAVGYWYGTFLKDNNYGGNVGILFRSDGTLKVYDFYGAPSQTDTTKTLNATGTYTVTGTTVNFNYAFAAESFTAQGSINTQKPVTIQYTFTDPNYAGLGGTGTVSMQ